MATYRPTPAARITKRPGPSSSIMQQLALAVAKGHPQPSKGMPAKSPGSMPDAKHARLALQFVGRSEAAGNISSDDAAKIRARANGMLGK